MIRANPELLAYIDSLFNKNTIGIDLEKYVSKDKVMLQEKRYNSVFLIKEGIAKCYLTDENGKDFIQEFLGEGLEFGELEIYTNKLSFCTIEAITPLTVYKISHETYKKLLDEDKKFINLILKAMAYKISYKAPRHSYQQGYSIENNIVKLQKEYPEFTKIIPKQDIANFLGITLRSLNRVLREMN